MKKFLMIVVTAVVGYGVFLKVQETAQRQATWEKVSDPV